MGEVEGFSFVLREAVALVLVFCLLLSHSPDCTS